MKTKNLIIVGGANGVGKTTFAYQYSNEYGVDYLGADAIAAGIDKKGSENIELMAGKLFFKKLDEYYTKNEFSTNNIPALLIDQFCRKSLRSVLPVLKVIIDYINLIHQACL